MTDLVVAVRLKADGSGLVGQMRLSKESVDELKRAATQAGAAAEAMAANLTRAGAASQGAAGAVLNMAVANARAERATKELTAAQAALTAAVEAGSAEQVQAAAAVVAAQQRVAAAQAGVARAQRQAGQAGVEAARSLGSQRSAYSQLGFQIQDITQSIALGTNAFTILAQQGGQTASAIEQLGLKGAGGRVAAFFAGPWGAVFLAATAVLGPFVLKLFESKDAATDLADNLAKAVSAADSFGNAQAILGKVIDLTTGKLKTQNKVLIETIRLQAEAALRQGRDDERNARKAIGQLGEPTVFDRLLSSPGLAGPSYLSGSGQAGERSARLQLDQRQQSASLRQVRDDVLAGKIDVTETRKRIDLLERTGKLAAYSADQISEFKKQLYALPQARNDQKAAQFELDALDGKGIAPDLRPYERDKKPKKPKSTAGLKQFGESTGDRLRGIATRYADLPPAVREAQGALQQLDAIAREVQQRKPPNFEALITQIGAARTAIAGGLKGDIAKIAEQFDNAGAAAKRTADATAQIDEIIAFLNKTVKESKEGDGVADLFKPLIADAERARAAIEGSVLKPLTDIFDQQRDQLEVGSLILRGRSDEAQALQIVLGLQRQGLKLTEDQRAALVAGVQAIAAQSRQIEALQRRQQNLLRLSADVRSSIVDAFAGQSDDLAGSLVAAFRRAFAEQLTEQLFGKLFESINARILGEKIDAPAQRFAEAVDKAVDPLGRLAKAAGSAADALLGGGDGEGVLGGGVASGLIAALTGIPRDGFGTGGVDQNGQVDVTVTAKQTARSVSTIEGLLGGIGRDGLKLGGISSIVADRLGGAITGALKGAGTGLAVAGLAQSVGLKLDNTGAAIGGALGSLLPIPGGQIIGSIAGGLFGKLFAPTPKAKGGAITNVDDRVNVTGTNAQAKDAVAQASRAVQDGIQTIADQLGAQIGSFNVSIAKYKDSFRVDPTGSGSDGGKYGNKYVAGIGKFDNNDAAGAIAFAIADAIKDGAIKGISPAVAKALQSSTDINKALKEALKVRDLEALIGGPAYAIKKTIDDFDALAAERVDLARKYGFDLIAVERKNAEERARVLDDTLKSRVGELKSFLDSVKYGDLFEGSAADRRKQILAEIAAAQAEFDAGVEDAQSRLGALYQQLLTSSRDAFGTAGPEYSADRTTAISGAERNIAAEQARIDAASGAAKATTDAVMAGNVVLDEIAGLTAITNGKLDALIALSGGGGSGLGETIGDYGNWLSAPNLGLTIRNAL